jgi:hypothetical protein
MMKQSRRLKLVAGVTGVGQVLIHLSFRQEVRKAAAVVAIKRSPSRLDMNFFILLYSKEFPY